MGAAAVSRRRRCAQSRGLICQTEAKGGEDGSRFAWLPQPTGFSELRKESAKDDRTLRSVADLAQSLIYDFPRKGRGDEYKNALKVWFACLEGGDGSAEDARAAFAAGAHEADLLVLPDDGPDT
jgi:hypothetical protein